MYPRVSGMARWAVPASALLAAAACGGRARSDGGSDAAGSTDAGSATDAGGASDGGGAACPGFPPPPQSGAGTTHYVSPTGSDANPGTETAPFATLQAAADVVNPGDTVIVEDGTYTNPVVGPIVTIDRGGAPGDFVWFRARNRWGARLDGLGNTNPSGFHFAGGAGWVRIEGFEIFGVGNGGIGGASGIDVYEGGHDSEILGNHIHDVGRLCSDTDNGLNGLFLQQPNVLVEANLLHDIGRFAPGENGCVTGNANWQNHDHGVYVDGATDATAPGADGATIRNNVFYGFARGWPIQIYPGALDGVTVANNTFSGANPDRDGHIVIYDMDLTGSVIVNNVFDGPTNAALTLGGTLSFAGVVVTHNLTTVVAMTNLTPDPPGLTVADNLTSASPGFVDGAAFDFHLAAVSAAAEAGEMRPDVPLDFDGCTRPRGAAWDVGAFER